MDVTCLYCEAEHNFNQAWKTAIHAGLLYIQLCSQMYKHIIWVHFISTSTVSKNMHPLKADSNIIQGGTGGLESLIYIFEWNKAKTTQIMNKYFTHLKLILSGALPSPSLLPATLPELLLLFKSGLWDNGAGPVIIDRFRAAAAPDWAGACGAILIRLGKLGPLFWLLVVTIGYVCGALLMYWSAELADGKLDALDVLGILGLTRLVAEPENEYKNMMICTPISFK